MMFVFLGFAANEWILIFGCFRDDSPRYYIRVNAKNKCNGMKTHSGRCVRFHKFLRQ